MLTAYEETVRFVEIRYWKKANKNSCPLDTGGPETINKYMLRDKYYWKQNSLGTVVAKEAALLFFFFLST